MTTINKWSLRLTDDLNSFSGILCLSYRLCEISKIYVRFEGKCYYLQLLTVFFKISQDIRDYHGAAKLSRLLQKSLKYKELNRNFGISFIIYFESLRFWRGLKTSWDSRYLRYIIRGSTRSLRYPANLKYSAKSKSFGKSWRSCTHLKGFGCIPEIS